MRAATAAVLLALPALTAAFLPPMPAASHNHHTHPGAAAKTRRFINSDGSSTDVDVAGKLDPSRWVSRSVGLGRVGGVWVPARARGPSHVGRSMR